MYSHLISEHFACKNRIEEPRRQTQILIGVDSCVFVVLTGKDEMASKSQDWSKPGTRSTCLQSADYADSHRLFRVNPIQKCPLLGVELIAEQPVLRQFWFPGSKDGRVRVCRWVELVVLLSLVRCCGGYSSRLPGGSVARLPPRADRPSAGRCVGWSRCLQRSRIASRWRL